MDLPASDPPDWHDFVLKRLSRKVFTICRSMHAHAGKAQFIIKFCNYTRWSHNLIQHRCVCCRPTPALVQKGEIPLCSPSAYLIAGGKPMHVIWLHLEFPLPLPHPCNWAELKLYKLVLPVSPNKPSLTLGENLHLETQERKMSRSSKSTFLQGSFHPCPQLLLQGQILESWSFNI